MVRMSATDVARHFSSVINRVCAGEEIEIIRNGAPVAELRPPTRPRRLNGDAWRGFIEKLPRIDEDFARDVEDARKGPGPPAGTRPAG
jgi:antitoxin (DNA-binding transcriptional repressor) of toxin-antitoxin stability system